MRLKMITIAAGLAAAISVPANAQQYVSASAGFNFQADSDNAGAFTRDFVTGDGVAVPAGTTLPNGTDLGWTTEFETGLFAAGAIGFRLNDAVRLEAELSYAGANVDTHEGVQAGGAALGAADAAVLITGAAPLGVTVADLVADGQGEATSLGLAANIYYDFALDGAPFDLYAGAGLGLADVEIEYSPSDVVIIDDSQTAAFLQVMLGGAVPISENTDLFGGYRYRAFNDIEVQSVLVPADLDIEYANHILEFGVRVSF